MPSMKLEEFVAETLTEIISGVKKAQAQPETGNYISSAMIGGVKFPESSGVVHEARLLATTVKFDVAVTAEKSAEAGPKAGIKIGVADFDIGGSGTGSVQEANRIQFSVPVFLPRPVDGTTPS